ncbi:sigma-54-dependent transcriptional regulator [Thermodesulfobacteriota bacterium]
MKYNILIVDDEEIIRSSLRDYLRAIGYEVDTSKDGKSAIDRVKYNKPDLVLLDLCLPDMDGLEVLREVLKVNEDLLVILITGYGTVEIAASAMKEGAYDVISKPIEADKVEMIVEKALKTISLKKEIETIYVKEIDKFNDNFIIDEDSIMNHILKNLKNAAVTDVPILITGESGTGKEILARAAYYYSNRVSKPFISINCSAIPTEILESELFGYEKGSFTGASPKGKAGIFEAADGGTVFFDEIGELDTRAQAKLLRFLQEKEIQKVGSTKLKKVDVRVIAATNKDLMREVAKKTFREDLFYRLNVFNIIVPPLKERREDIIPLSKYFVDKFSNEFKKEVTGLDKKVEEELINMSWKGNIRELQNTIARAVIMCSGKTLCSGDIIFEDNGEDFHSGKKDDIIPLYEVKRKYTIDALKRMGNNKARTAKKLDISVNTLKSIIK